MPKEYLRLTTRRSSATATAAPASCAQPAGTRRWIGAADGLRAAGVQHGARTYGVFSCSKATNEVNFAAQKFSPRRPRQQQHRQLQPHLTRPLCRRSGDRVRRWRRDQLISRDRGDGPRPPVGHERPGDAPDLLPPPPEGGASGCPADHHRPAPHQLSAEWADLWLGLDVGSDIALANAMAPRDHPRRPRERGVHRPGDVRLRGLPRRASSRTRSSTPSARPASRPRRSARRPTRTPTPTGR